MANNASQTTENAVHHVEIRYDIWTLPILFCGLDVAEVWYSVTNGNGCHGNGESFIL
jgi:hypothetical protein